MTSDRVERAVAEAEASIARTRSELALLDDAACEDSRGIATRLQLMVRIDQAARGADVLVGLEPGDAWAAEEQAELMRRLGPLMAEADAQHVDVLDALLERTNPFSISAFGEVSARHAWLLVQHADRNPELQERALQMMRSLPVDDVDVDNLAYLHDRVAVNRGRPQRYGTQGACVPGQGWQPSALEDEARVDEYRAEARLSPLDEYRALFDEWCPS